MDGFKITVNKYCSYCENFIPENMQTNITSCGDKQRKFLNEIHCKHKLFCAQIAQGIEERVKTE